MTLSESVLHSASMADRQTESSPESLVLSFASGYQTASTN